MNILGIWDGHDAGAALIVDRQVVAAINEERLSRRKLDVHFPVKSIQACLTIAGLLPQDVQAVAACTTDVAKTLGRWLPGLKETYHHVRRRKVPPGRFAGPKKRAKYWITEWAGNGFTRYLSLVALRRELRRLGIPETPLTLHDHHDCHAATAAWTSGFASCAVVTVDGVGDGVSSTVSVLADGQLKRLATSHARDSLGIFFEHVTNLLNMRELEDEGKVMALADYAAPIPDELNPLLSIFTVRDGRITSRIPGHAMMAHLRSVQWTYPNEQFAYLAQRVVEDVCVRLAADAVRLAAVNRVAIAGGVASNVKANRRIRLIPGIEDVYVFPHMGDGGLALGAALQTAHASKIDVRWNGDDLGLGPAYSDLAIRHALTDAGIAATECADLPGAVADLVANDRIVLWFNGHMEYGPRALGHRSVLARPDRASLRDRLNLALKQRVWYQPFCPTILEDDARRILLDYDGTRSNPHMTMAYMVAPEFRESLVGVTSVDGSCRPQIIPESSQGDFPEVLKRLRATLGLGVLLNTSLNIHGEPLVCSPQEAIEVFRRTGADALAMGPYLAIRDSLD